MMTTDTSKRMKPFYAVNKITGEKTAILANSFIHAYRQLECEDYISDVYALWRTEKTADLHVELIKNGGDTRVQH